MKKTTTLLALILMVASVAQAENWGQFRGPNFNGSTSEKNLPSKWSQTENVAWVTDLPGASAATPIVWGDHVLFLRPMPRPRRSRRCVLIARRAKFFGVMKSAKGLTAIHAATTQRQHQRQMGNMLFSFLVTVN